MPTLAIVAPLLTDAEAAVKQLVEARAAAVQEREELMGPVTMLQGVIAAAEVEERTVAGCRAADDAVMDEWLASDGSTPQPVVPSSATRDAEERAPFTRSPWSIARRTNCMRPKTLIFRPCHTQARRRPADTAGR